MRFSLLALTSALLAPLALAQDAAAPVAPLVEIGSTWPDLDTSLAGNREVINGAPARVNIAFKNTDPSEALVVSHVQGAWYDLAKPDIVVRNMTVSKLNTPVPPTGSLNIPYQFTTDLAPGTLGLLLTVYFTSAANPATIFQALAHNATVIISDPPFSIFDPSVLFLYTTLLALMAGIAYYAYGAFIAPPSTGKKRSTGAKKVAKAEPVEAVAPVEASAGATTSAKGYDESWIPEHHLRPRSRQSGPRPSTPRGGSAKKVQKSKGVTLGEAI
ncbi:hypothetical protein SAICODRAFT_6065 [Saitoella complicata NRRL Y-17804]|uniref:Uncharacterized protein n=1 Tax=Saitoella complicata (strain BCRC 22490 / CBS 7301 / JCM 7358 / NBRC 10748 / NRRL Y-17804) TaxID=698492 RepID=A0A0E9N7H4_SAICN|nr:uncharacterized protein SAICODRAFT_6065 [Saitoella complicata NRRL Y-17804]ODQ54300.1 hypothetical protein SAICODRAFT_6065 [Saitoella complicata NRRL Y-17804]GAO45758.1 hypothetical protein G7K_0010-t1 [Saitoella complicata NRRL Y-17804]